VRDVQHIKLADNVSIQRGEVVEEGKKKLSYSAT